MSDLEYIEFYEKNKNKTWSEIEPKELADKLIAAYASTIHSNVRYGDRAYTEFYGSNPKRVNSAWVYSYDKNEKISNPLEFLNRTYITKAEEEAGKIGGEEIRSVAERTQFLRDFCLQSEHDIPMFIFGD